MTVIGPDPRVHPFIDLDPERVRAMLSPMNLRGELVDVSPIGEGLVNSLYRVRLRQPDASYALRLHAGDRCGFDRERQLLPSLATALPVPRVLFTDATCSRCAHPYTVYPWMEGITLNEFRRRSSTDVLLSLAAPLGELAARIATTDAPAASDRSMRIAERLESAQDQLHGGLARKRLGDTLAKAMRHRLTDETPRLLELDDARGLVHGDFGGRNVLVRQTEGGAWEVSGVLDWDSAATGSPMWDVGSLFRYHRRYSVTFRDQFAGGYRTAGGSLPDDWWLAARLLDVTRLIAILNQDRDLPSVFAECRELIEQLTFHDRHASAL